MRAVEKRNQTPARPFAQNKPVYEPAWVPEIYGYNTRLLEVEEVILSTLREEIKGKPILDIGIRAGRTTPYLRAISEDYIGTDWSEQRISLCKKRFSDSRFLVCDARNMSIFDNEQFAAVFLWGSEFDEADLLGRMLILKEVKRVLKKGGIFALSNHIFEARAVNSFEGFSFLHNPKAFISKYIIHLLAHLDGQFKRLIDEIGNLGYMFLLLYAEVPDTFIFERVHCVKKETQIRELSYAGFHEIEVVDKSGSPGFGEQRHRDSLTHYIARKR